jgi:hypothetical protein
MVDFIASLPAELAFHILSYFDYISHSNAMAVSRTWYSRANDEHLWRKLSEQVPCASSIYASEWKSRCKLGFKLEQNWKVGKSRHNSWIAHAGPVYCLQFDE